MRASNRVGIGLSYRPARLHRLAEVIPWNRFLGSIKVKQIRAQGAVPSKEYRGESSQDLPCTFIFCKWFVYLGCDLLYISSNSSRRQSLFPFQRGRILRRNWDKSLRNFPPWYSLSTLLMDFTPPPPTLEQKWFETGLQWKKLYTETSSLRTLKIMPKNLNEIVHSWIQFNFKIFIQLCAYSAYILSGVAIPLPEHQRQEFLSKNWFS